MRRSIIIVFLFFICLIVLFDCSKKSEGENKKVEKVGKVEVKTYDNGKYGFYLKNMPLSFKTSDKIIDEGSFEESYVLTITDKGKKICEIFIMQWSNAASLALGDTGLKIANEDALKEEIEVNDWDTQPIKIDKYSFESMNQGIICNIHVIKEYSNWIKDDFSFNVQ